MRNVLFSALLLGVIGLGVGYFLFAGRAGSYVPVGRLLGISHNDIQGLVYKLFPNLGGIEVVRRNILISGLVGVVVGLIASLAARSRRR